MALDLEIDTVILTNQPTTIDIEEPSARLTKMANGGWSASSRAKGTRVKVTWGVDVSPTAVMAELRTARNSLVAHQLEWNDVTGTAHLIQVLWPKDPDYDINAAFLYDRITVEFRESA